MFYLVKEIPANLDTEIILKRLYIAIKKSNPDFNLSMSLGTNKKIFTGQIKGNTFSISRILGYQNSFNPLIEGKLITENDKKKLILKMVLSPMNKSLLITFGILISILFLAGLSVLLYFKITNLKACLIIFGFPVFYLVFLGLGQLIFNSMAKDSTRLFHAMCNRQKTPYI